MRKLSHTFSLFLSPSLDLIFFFLPGHSAPSAVVSSSSGMDVQISRIETTALCQSISQLVVRRGYPLISNTVRCRLHQYLLGAVFARLPCPSLKLARLAFQPEILQIVLNNALSVGRLSFGAYSAQDIAGPLYLARICTALRRSSFWARAVHQLGKGAASTRHSYSSRAG
jgi:hypothetical protein